MYTFTVSLQGYNRHSSTRNGGRNVRMTFELSTKKLMRILRYLVRVSACLFVCLFVYIRSRNTACETAHERYKAQQGPKTNVADFAKSTAFES